MAVHPFDSNQHDLTIPEIMVQGYRNGLQQNAFPALAIAEMS